LIAFYLAFRIGQKTDFNYSPYKALFLSEIGHGLALLENQPESFEALERLSEFCLLCELLSCSAEAVNNIGSLKPVELTKMVEIIEEPRKQ